MDGSSVMSCWFSKLARSKLPCLPCYSLDCWSSDSWYGDSKILIKARSSPVCLRTTLWNVGVVVNWPIFMFAMLFSWVSVLLAAVDGELVMLSFSHPLEQEVSRPNSQVPEMVLPPSDSCPVPCNYAFLTLPTYHKSAPKMSRPYPLGFSLLIYPSQMPCILSLPSTA